MRTFIFRIKGEVPGKITLDGSTMIAASGATQERAFELLQERLERVVEVLNVYEETEPYFMHDHEFVNVGISLTTTSA